MRSFRLNFELNVEIYDEDLAEQITGIMENKMTRRLTQADLVGRSLLVRLRDAGARLLLPYI
jgi:cardiolipin synthase